MGRVWTKAWWFSVELRPRESGIETLLQTSVYDPVRCIQQMLQFPSCRGEINSRSLSHRYVAKINRFCVTSVPGML